MKLKEYVENLNKFIEQNPEALEMKAVYSGDDEGNSFSSVHYTPSLGYYDIDDRVWYNVEDSESGVPNAVCVN